MTAPTVTYTFSPNTTAASAQVNQDFTDLINYLTNRDNGSVAWSVVNANTLELNGTAITLYPTGYRRPVLKYSSGSVVNLETGINGTSGQVAIMFPDGTLRTDSTSGRINCNLAQVASLTGTAQSGIQTGSVASNTWYAFYAVKSQVNTTDIVTVADVTLPIQANFSTLNGNYGTNSWVYLGVLPYGDNSGATSAIPKFAMSSNTVIFYNSCTGNAQNGRGARLVTSGGGTSLSFNYSAGGNLSTPQVPNNLTFAKFQVAIGTVAPTTFHAGGSGNSDLAVSGVTNSTNAVMLFFDSAISDGANISGLGSNGGLDIFLAGYEDGVLGIGSNPLL